MANLCCYDLFATGSIESIQQFALMMKWETSPAITNSMYCSDMYEEYEEPKDNGDGTFTQHFSSATRWSVQGAMIDRCDSTEYISLPTAARTLGIVMEIYSDEPGCCFSEHIFIHADGSYEVKCVDYHEIYGEDLEEECEKTLSEITTDDLRTYLESFMSDEQIESLDLDRVLSFLRGNERGALGGFDYNSDFPFNA